MRQLTDYEIKINREAEDKVRKALDQFFDIVEEQGFDDKAIASNLLIVAIERVYELSDSDEQFFRIVLSIAKEVPPEKQDLRLHLKRLPGNRIITIVKGFIGREEVLIDLSKYLKKSCGVGGSVKNHTIIIQGNHRDKILELLNERGFKVKVSGD